MRAHLGRHGRAESCALPPPSARCGALLAARQTRQPAGASLCPLGAGGRLRCRGAHQARLNSFAHDMQVRPEGWGRGGRAGRRPASPGRRLALEHRCAQQAGCKKAGCVTNEIGAHEERLALLNTHLNTASRLNT